MNFYRAHALRGRRRGKSPHDYNSAATSTCLRIVAALAFFVSVEAASANPSTPASNCARETIVAATTCPASQKFATLLDYPSDSPILNLRAAALSLSDITGSIPDLRLDPVPAKPTAPAPIALLSPPETIEAIEAEADAAPAAPMIVGIASMYNPHNPDDKDAGGPLTASGELYDAEDWTAAIRLDLRGRFGGVGYGRNYRPTYAMVEAGGKRAIVKINDVGPLKPGRIIDLNERTMRFFDPSLQLGLISGIRLTPLEGTNWISGPIGGSETILVAGNFSP